MRTFRLVALMVLALSTSALAQAQSGTEGLFLNGRINGSAIQLDVENAVTESGGGIGAMIGYGFTPQFAIYLALDGASIQSESALFSSSYGLGYFDIGARYHFANSQRSWVPYLDAALSGQAVAAEVGADEVEMIGSGFSVGGGILFFLSYPIALDLGLKWTFGNFREATVNGVSTTLEDVGTNAARFTVGLSWFPMH